MNDFKHWEIAERLIQENRIRYYRPVYELTSSFCERNFRDLMRPVWFDDGSCGWSNDVVMFVREETRKAYPPATNDQIEEVVSYVLDMAPWAEKLERLTERERSK